MATDQKRPPVSLDLSGVDGNIFAIIGAFRRAARTAGWATAEIDSVVTEARSGNYDHLLQRFLSHATTPAGRTAARESGTKVR